MKFDDIVKVFDILGKFEFFGGQRAGRELWFDKPADIQDEDIKQFVDDVNFLKNFIDQQKAEIEELRQENLELKDGYFQKRYEEVEHQELMGLREAWRKSTDQNMDLQLEIERLETENKEQDQAIINALHRMGQIRAEALKEFAERLKNKFYSYYEGLDENTSKSKYNGETLMYYEVADMIENCIDNTVKEMTEEPKEGHDG